MNARCRTHVSLGAVRKLAVALAFAGCALPALAQQVVTVGIGTQNTTTNTVTGGIVIVTSVILLTTTALAVRDARSEGPGWLG